MEFLENNPIEYGEIISRTKIGILGDPNTPVKLPLWRSFLITIKLNKPNLKVVVIIFFRFN